ncbi:hypothetical protein EIP91_000005 [Steccherinum ochraceum]|uniref:ferric-chelate reductase (NADPH) n=1 Tax=Steccherinum ochraceum TaxID=92696 RepID=A0A4R0RVV2_9APHY|nr:hypothetical protein EIP91_000005 [Steccherinum ochraceum]
MSSSPSPSPPSRFVEFASFIQLGRRWIAGPASAKVPELQTSDIQVADLAPVYSYILWIIVGVAFIFFSVVHGTGLRAGYYGALWSKWSLRRRTWRKKHSLALAAKTGKPYRPPVALPSNAQILTLFTIIICSLLLAYVGPDYFAPGSYLWNVGTTPTVTTKRAAVVDTFTQFQPRYTIVKTWWTSAARTGQIAFALFPLCIILALKAPPFAIFSISFLTNFHFDKLSWLHRWCGFLVWMITTLHVVSWSVQLASDRRQGTGKIVYTYAWMYDKFIFGWIAYIALTFIILGSLPPIRGIHYEIFYFLHILFVPLMLVTAAFHHPPVWEWCWGAIALWAAERLYRFIWFLRNNGIVGGAQSGASKGSKGNKLTKKPSQKSVYSARKSLPQSFPMHTLDLETPIEGPRASRMFQYPTASSVHELASHANCYTPPPGFVHAELLSGSTVRLTLVPPSPMTWAPGQHFLVNIPSIGRLTTHPFTCASVCDESARTGLGRALVFLIRAKKGWTKALRNTVTQLVSHGRKYPPTERVPSDVKLPEHGVLMHGMVDGPFGSAARADWGAYSSVLIVAGGSGVSFGLSILELMTQCLSGRDGRHFGSRAGGWRQRSFKTTRVRFVWLVREFGHIQWCASALRRCMALVPSSELQIDIFVTNAKPHARFLFAPSHPHLQNMKLEGLEEEDENELAPPEPQFVKEEGQTRNSISSNRSSRHSLASVLSSDSEESVDSDVDLSYYAGDFVDEEHGEFGHEDHVLDYTNFDGDDDSVLPGEDQLNMSVRKEGKRRRSYVRRTSMAVPAGFEFGQRSSIALSVYDPTPAPSASAVRLIEPSSRPTLTSLEPIGEHIRQGSTFARLQGPNSPLTPYSDMSTPTSAAALLSHTFPPPSSSPLHQSTAATQIPQSSSLTSLARPLSQASQLSQMTDWSSHSLAALVHGADNVRLELNETELADVSVVAERARPGKPKLDRILADEVERSKGAVVVGCCGPTSLNAMMRKHIAAQINPERIRQGDMRGSIALVAEDFEY